MTLRLFNVDEARRTILRRGVETEAIPESVRDRIRQVFGEEISPEEAVQRILADVRTRGDAALHDWTARIDGVALDRFEISPAEMEEAVSRLPRNLVEALRFAAERIRAFHARQPLNSWTTTDLGGRLGQTMTPLERVGVYVPGGSAPLPSSLLMSAIPAQVAGVKEIVVATPPGREDRRAPEVILAAAQIAGAATVYRLGGAQAIAALAFGTESIRRVDKIVGPGNLFVTLAKKQVFGIVGLDGLAGPTETVVVADETANPARLAADLLAQAEHDVLACAILLTPSRRLAEAVQIEAGRQLEMRGRAEIIAASLAHRSGIVLTETLAQAVALADEFAPEHLCLSVAEPQKWKRLIRHAGGLFVGERSFEVLGDYVAGPSHVMPTGGTARFASPLTALDFVRITNVIELDDDTAAVLSEPAARLAYAEQLDAHAFAATLRCEPSSVIRHQSSVAGRSVRQAVTQIEPYVPILPFEVLAEKLGRRAEQIVKLDANENPYGPSPKARQALARAAGVNIYPDPESTALRRALAKFSGLPIENLMAGAGADELIDLILRATIDPGDVVIDCPPTFGMYAFSAAVNAARVVNAPRCEDFSVDVEAVEAVVRAEPKAKVLFVCSPNNPDGGMISDDDLRRLLALPLLVVLDEAYVEFAGGSRIGWALEYDNLAVLRTFSKWAGLAGLRLGWGAFPDWLIRELWKIKQPYNVNAAASAAAIASLEDYDWLKANVDRIAAERERLWRRLDELGWLRPYPTRANFVLCRVDSHPRPSPPAPLPEGEEGKGQWLKTALEREGVMVRFFDKPRLRDCIRISVGTPGQSEALMEAMRQVSGKW